MQVFSIDKDFPQGHFIEVEDEEIPTITIEPTEADRISALEFAMLDLILGGDVSV